MKLAKRIRAAHKTAIRVVISARAGNKHLKGVPTKTFTFHDTSVGQVEVFFRAFMRSRGIK